MELTWLKKVIKYGLSSRLLTFKFSALLELLDLFTPSNISILSSLNLLAAASLTLLVLTRMPSFLH